MADVTAALRDLQAIGLDAVGPLKSLANKHHLLVSLLDNEQMRLEVWLHPLDHDRRHFFHSTNSNKLSQEVGGTGSWSLQLSTNLCRLTC